MNSKLPARKTERANALVITMVLTATALLTLSGILAWSNGGARQSYRFDQYTRTVSAAEASTEKAAGQMSQDFLNYGEAYVDGRMSTYQADVPLSTDSSYWANWQFNDTQGNNGKNYVNRASTSNYTVLTGTYAGLQGYVSTYNVVCDATETTDLQPLTVGNLQTVQLNTIPIFQFAMYSTDDMEIGCGAPFYINGPVHSNGNLYVEPDSVMTFESPVTAVKSVLFARDPLDSRGAPAGSVTYEAGEMSGTPTLTLPIGATNTSAAIAQIIQPPPAGESATSSLGSQRFYNKSDLIMNVTSSGVTVTSGLVNNFATTIPSNQVALFATCVSNFYDWREGKTVKPVDINIGMLTKWSATNRIMYPILGRTNISSIYVYEHRTLPSTQLVAVRVFNGTVLPPLGLTVATADPLYVQGDYNQTNSANLNTSNTTTTLPAMFACDAITYLSNAWLDSQSTMAVNNRWAAWSTLNAAVIAGSVYTTNGIYSGGMEDFIRFLEDWSQWNTFTFNGSLVQLYPSVVATNYWGNQNAYSPPTRQWSFDNNFTLTTKLPPLTPGLQTASRSQWATLVPNSRTASTNAF